MLKTILSFITIQIIYRPFLNILVLLYEYLPWGQDMGVALIVFTIFLSVLLLPLSLSGEESEEERQELMRKLAEIEETHKGYPLQIQKEKEKLIRAHRGVIRLRYLSFAVYLIYFVVLYRVFKTGLKGADLRLLYTWVPKPTQPLNLKFLGTLDLISPSPALNAFSAFLTFIAETLGILFSPYPATRDDRLVQFLAPFAAFFITYRIPAGQELFFTVSLLSTIALMFIREGISLARLAKVKRGKRSQVRYQ